MSIVDETESSREGGIGDSPPRPKQNPDLRPFIDAYHVATTAQDAKRDQVRKHRIGPHARHERAGELGLVAQLPGWSLPASGETDDDTDDEVAHRSLTPPTPPPEQVRLPEWDRLFRSLWRGSAEGPRRPPVARPRPFTIQPGEHLAQTANGQLELSGTATIGFSEHHDPAKDPREEVEVVIRCGFVAEDRRSDRLDARHAAALFHPRALDDAKREELGLPPGTVRYIDLRGQDLLQPIEGTPDVDVWVDEEVLAAVGANHTAAAVLFQRQLMLDFVGSVVFEYSTTVHATAPASVDDSEDDFRSRSSGSSRCTWTHSASMNACRRGCGRASTCSEVRNLTWRIGPKAALTSGAATSCG